ncbi:hypothetical protein WN55_05883 [Dufourea novaeangliae]|uniref:Uncharacterized protein n=1 Tax=Dufourea novaeangliae TaxID=178035 RepID=A0A154PMW4_DUFNO|nr:hypothetical protein WN55_05883 [Dufourea novaeangliae]
MLPACGSAAVADAVSVITVCDIHKGATRAMTIFHWTQGVLANMRFVRRPTYVSMHASTVKFSVVPAK